MADSSTTPPKKKTRSATTLPEFTSRRPAGYKYPIEFDQRLEPLGKLAAKFKSYVSLLARSKASILAEAWDKVDGTVKDLIWMDILETFDIPNDERLKKKWIAYGGERWTQFKTSLTRRYIFSPRVEKDNTTPCEQYSFITAETWESFVKSRMEENFQIKREKAKEIQSHNNFYHTSSRGGYKMVKDKWKKRYVEAMREESGDPDLVVDPPSPPRHELFKLAHQKKTGSFTTDNSASVASKIDELVDQAKQGTLVPHGRQDILTIAIGKPDHRGCVRAAGRGVGLSQYFGPTSRTSLPTDSKKLGAMKVAMKQELREELTLEFEKKHKDMIDKALTEKFGSFGSPSNEYVSTKNTIGSKASCSPSHVEEPPKNDWLKELHSLAYEITESVMFDLDHERQEHFYIGYKEIVEMVRGKAELEMSHLAIWCTYLHRECISREITDMYGFLDPYKICGSNGCKEETIQIYIQNKLIDQKKTCFLAPYLSGKHWQLFVICPSVNTVVWMCSLHCLPNETLVEIVDKALNGYNRMSGFRKTKPKWVTLKGPKQNDTYSCGHYVMINMMTIVSATITNNWNKMFNSSSYTLEELKDIRQVWAEFFIKLYAERKPISKEERRKQPK